MHPHSSPQLAHHNTHHNRACVFFFFLLIRGAVLSTETSYGSGRFGVGLGWDSEQWHCAHGISPPRELFLGSPLNFRAERVRELQKKKPKPQTQTPPVVIFAALTPRSSFPKPSTPIPIPTNPPTHTTMRWNRALRTEVALVIHLLVIRLVHHPTRRHNRTRNTRRRQSSRKRGR